VTGIAFAELAANVIRELDARNRLLDATQKVIVTRK